MGLSDLTESGLASMSDLHLRTPYHRHHLLARQLCSPLEVQAIHHCGYRCDPSLNRRFFRASDVELVLPQGKLFYFTLIGLDIFATPEVPTPLV